MNFTDCKLKSEIDKIKSQRAYLKLQAHRFKMRAANSRKIKVRIHVIKLVVAKIKRKFNYCDQKI